MIHLLTVEEAAFLAELSALMKKYHAHFSRGQEDDIEIYVYDGGNENTEKTPITFYDSFDTLEIRDLLEENTRQVDFIIEKKEVRSPYWDEETKEEETSKKDEKMNSEEEKIDRPCRC